MDERTDTEVILCPMLLDR